MSVKTFLTIISILGLFFGIGELLIPDRLAAIYGIETSRSVEMMARFFGVALLAWALIAWFAKDFHDEADLRHVLAPSGVAHTAGFIVATMGTMSGVMNAMGWVSAAIFLFGAIGILFHGRRIASRIGPQLIWIAAEISAWGGKEAPGRQTPAPFSFLLAAHY
jgi:hypothetical protein